MGNWVLNEKLSFAYVARTPDPDEIGVVLAENLCRHLQDIGIKDNIIDNDVDAEFGKNREAAVHSFEYAKAIAADAGLAQAIILHDP